MTTKKIELIAIQLINEIEKLNGKPPQGTCHLIAYLMVKRLAINNIKARTVTGNLELMDKSGKKVYYGNQNPNNKRNVGFYHTWCEAIINEERILIDPSLKYNIAYLKKFKIRINSKVPKVLVTDKFSTYYYVYSEDEKLKKLSDKELLNVPVSFIDELEKTFQKTKKVRPLSINIRNGLRFG